MLATATTEDQQRRTGHTLDPPPIGAHDITLVTPTGHRYRTRAPAHPAAPQQPPEIHLGHSDTTPVPPHMIPIEIHFHDVA